MINAADARQQAETILSAADEHTLKNLDVKVKRACETGARSVYVEKLNIRIQKKVKELGYEYKEYHGDQRDGSSYTLHW